MHRMVSNSSFLCVSPYGSIWPLGSYFAAKTVNNLKNCGLHAYRKSKRGSLLCPDWESMSNI